jgi:hypothetical protein
MESKFKFYSIGIVAKDKPLDSDVIEVNPIEHVGFFNGLLSSIKETYSGIVSNKDGKRKKVSLEGSVTVKATWLANSEGNRMSSPNVVAGETVRIWRFAETEEFYWSTFMREPLLRRLEKALYAWSNLRDGKGQTGFDRASSYWFEVDTINKYIYIKTTKSDGEPFEYDVCINAKDGVISIKDDIANTFIFNSGSSTLTTKMNESIILDAPSIILKASKAVTHITPVVLNSGDVQTTGSDTAAGQITSNSSMGSTNSQITITGNVNVLGSLTENGQPVRLQ